MNKPALALGILCIALAGVDAKLLLDLRAAHGGRAADAAPGAEASGSNLAPGTAGSPGVAGTSPTANGSVAGGESATEAKKLAEALARYAAAQAERSPQQKIVDADFLHMADDPRRKLQLIEEAALDWRKRFRGADRVLDIEAARLRMLSERLAAIEVDRKAARMRCAGDPVCMGRANGEDPVAEKSRTTREVLGEAKAEEFQTFEASLSERRAVETLQSRLRTAPLTSERADALILALSSESTRLRQGWSNGGGTGGFGTANLGMVFYPASITSIDQQVAAAREYSQHMRRSAAEFLTVEQRAEFDAMQDDLLERFERWRRR